MASIRSPAPHATHLSTSSRPRYPSAPRPHSRSVHRIWPPQRATRRVRLTPESARCPPRLNVQVYDKGERLVTIVVVDPDVPDLEKDNFGSRCHFLAVNVPISPTSTSVPLAKLKKGQHIVQPWASAVRSEGFSVSSPCRICAAARGCGTDGPCRFEEMAGEA